MLLRTAKIFLLWLIFSLCYIQPFARLFNFQVPPTEFIFLLTAALWILALSAGQTKFRFHRFYILLAFYFGALLCSAIFSDDRQTSFIKLGGELYLLLLPVLIFNLVEDENDLKRLIQSWLCGTAAAVFVGAIVILLFYFDRENSLLSYTVYSFGAVPVGNYPRLRVNFLTPSLLCNYLSVSFSLLLAAAHLKWIRKSLFLILATLIVLIAVFTISSGLGGFALIIGWWIFYGQRTENKFLAVSSLGGGTTAALLFWLMNFIALQPHSTAPYTFHVFGHELYPSPRLLVWTASLRTFRENLFFGRGVGQDSCQVVFQNTDGSFTALTDAHNIFLSVASQEGIFGLAAMLLLIFYLIRMSFTAALSTRKQSVISMSLLIAFVSAFIYQGLVGSFEDSRHLWALIGLMLCTDSLAHRAE